MLVYLIGAFVLYLFLQFQIAKIKNPLQPNAPHFYTEQIEEFKKCDSSICH
jgi:hypothetical protein